MGQGLLSTQSLFCFVNEQTPNQVLALFRNTLELFMVEVEASVFDLAENFRGRVSLERQVAGNKGVEDDTKRPNIGFLAVRAIEDLRGHVVWRASYGSKVFLVPCGL